MEAVHALQGLSRGLFNVYAAVGAIAGAPLLFLAGVALFHEPTPRQDGKLSFLDKTKVLLRAIRLKLTAGQHDNKADPKTAINLKKFLGSGQKIKMSKKYMTPEEAAKLVPDDSVVLTCGFGATERCSAMFWALKDRFKKEQHPTGLTYVTVSAQGNRGKLPGGNCELAVKGMVKRYITGHLETSKAFLKAAEEGWMELYNLPQGEMALLIEQQWQSGETERTSTVGVGSFLDPRVGSGGIVTPKNATFTPVRVAKNPKDGLVFTLPHLDVTLFNARYADPEGNIYLYNNVTVTETLDGVAAAKMANGVVIAQVQEIIPYCEHLISIRASEIDALIVSNFGPNSDGVGIRDALLPKTRYPTQYAWNIIRFLNTVVKVTPRRTAIDYAVARLASKYTLRALNESAAKPKLGDASAKVNVNIGVGLPEEVGVLLRTQSKDVADRLLFCTESGTVGGTPGAGMFFGAGIAPDEIQSSSWMFNFLQGNLDVTVLGALEVDGLGNVNVSNRGPKISDIVGCGGFPNLVHEAKCIVFVASWATHSSYKVHKSNVEVKKLGASKFIPKVREITFCADSALEPWKPVYYVTNVGVFQLGTWGATAEGTPIRLKLIEILPGIDVEKHIKAVAQCPLCIPDAVTVADPSVLHGHHYSLAFER